MATYTALKQKDSFMRYEKKFKISISEYPLLKIHLKKLHFKSIEFFPKCVNKYFLQIVSKVLIEDSLNYGGMEKAFTKFQDKIYQKL